MIKFFPIPECRATATGGRKIARITSSSLFAAAGDDMELIGYIRPLKTGNLDIAAVVPGNVSKIL